MSPHSIVKRDDVVKDRQSGLVARTVAVLIDQLRLERVEETFRDGIVEAVPGPTGADDDGMSIQRAGRPPPSTGPHGQE